MVEDFLEWKRLKNVTFVQNVKKALEDLENRKNLRNSKYLILLIKNRG